jgi:putative membrane protein
MVKLRSLVVLFVTSLLALAGCSKDESTPEPEYGASSAAGPGASAGDETTTSVEYAPPPKQEPSEAASAKAAATPPEGERKIQALSDGQILSVMTTVDKGEIEQAEIAQQKAIDPQVDRFASMMVKQHTASKQKAEKLVQRAALPIEPTPLADELAEKSDQMVKTLKDADSEAFDVLYMNGQVAQHAKVLGLIENQMIPSAVNAKLKSQLVEARKMVSDHLENAKRIQQELERE